MIKFRSGFMIYKWEYQTPDNFDNILLTSDGKYLTGLWFIGSHDDLKHTTLCEEKELPIFKETTKWLDIYFSGQEPKFTPKYKINNLTQFKKEVVDIMNEIPFGSTITYGKIALIIAKKRKIAKMSSRAVGQAVGSNPICLIIPCHRVVGINGNLTGYGGGIKNKIELLKLEKNDMSKFLTPKKGTKL